MGVGTSLFLIAVGAILKFAVTATVSGIDIATVGVILMVVGAVGLVLSLLALGRRARDGRRARARRRARPVRVIPRLSAAWRVAQPAAALPSR
jgi:hypothetical protein